MSQKKLRRRPLAIREVLGRADAYRESAGRWPTRASGRIVGPIGESWSMVDRALRDGLRGLPGGSSLAQVLADERGARNIQRLAPLSEDQILAYADAHHHRTGAWPTADAGAILDSGGEKWSAIDMALWAGARGLPGGASLARLLARRRGCATAKPCRS